MNPKRILFVDDEPNVLAAFQRQLRRQFDIVTAPGPIEGLAALKSGREFAVIVADMRMPEMNGVEFLIQARMIAPNAVRLMLTGNADQGTAIDAINEGNIFRFLNKPCPTDRLVAALDAAVRQHELINAERDLLERTLRGCIKVLAEILALTDGDSFGHAEALRDDVRRLAGHLKIGSQAWELEVAAMLARIGRVTIPPELALKARGGHSLTPLESELMERIPSIGGNLLGQIPRMEEISKIIQYQNKRFDGTGLPADAVAGNEIPFGARMLKALLDLAQVEAEGNSRSAALEQLRGRPGWYDPQILDAVGQCFAVQPHQKTKSAPPQAIPFVGLRVEHVLVSPIETKDGVLVIAAGNRITPALLQRLRNFSALSGIKEPIYVEAWGV